MKRIIDYYLQQWKNSPLRQPLLLRGARQVGKTYAVRALGQSFEKVIEINFDFNKKAKTLFNQDLDPHRILREVFVLTGQQVLPGKTLLFFDEIQAVPEGISALRYFYELMPELHIIAAGSLLDFAIEQVGIPVGRVQFLYMYPLSFIEFLAATNHHALIDEILTHKPTKPISEIVHTTVFGVLGNYLAIGGMPRAVACWKDMQNLQECATIPQTLIEAYQFDFTKYGKSHQIKYLDTLFTNLPQQLGKKFKYSEIGAFRKRDIEPCVELLVTAGVINRVMHADAQGLPLGAQADPQTFKLLLIDIALSQYMLDLSTGDWLLDPLKEVANKGLLVEAFVGQELIAYQYPVKKAQLYYWKRDKRGSEAEVDYVIQQEKAVIPIEVKSGTGNTLRRMQHFLASHPASPYGIYCSINNYSVHENIHAYPLYALAKLATDNNHDVKKSILSLIRS